MTVSKTTLEKAKEFKKWNEWDTSTSAEFAESILQEAAAELQKENARLREALERLSKVSSASLFEVRAFAKVALSKEKAK